LFGYSFGMGGRASIKSWLKSIKIF
jgi:hypothetical protein